MGIGVDRPRLSWSVATTVPGWMQLAYAIELFDSNGTKLDESGRIESNEAVLVAWPFERLESRSRHLIRVRVWSTDGMMSDWSELAPVEVGLLHPKDWVARFVTPDWDEDGSRPQPCPLLRYEFDVRPGVVKARLYVTAQGVYDVQINGAVVGDHVMAPGWTSYNHRLRYHTFDVTHLLQEGRNAIGAILGDGWFRGRLGFRYGRRLWGKGRVSPYAFYVHIVLPLPI